MATLKLGSVAGALLTIALVASVPPVATIALAMAEGVGVIASLASAKATHMISEVTKIPSDSRLIIG